MGKFVNLANKFKSLYTGKNAVITNTITAGTMGCLADTIAQIVEIKTSSNDQAWDLTRNKNMTVVSTFFGPIVYYWYRYLDNKFPGKTKAVLIRKVGLDLVIAPVWYGLFIGGISFLKSDSLKSSLEEYKEKAPLLLAADFALWPILQSFNFMVFPTHFRIIGLKCNEIIMGILTSHLINNDYGINKLLSKFSHEKKDNK